MGLLHMLSLPQDATGYDLDPKRVAWACSLGLNAKLSSNPKNARFVFVCPGTQAAFDFAMKIVEPGGTIVMFAPLEPGKSLQIPQAAYFSDVKLVNSYSCGPSDTLAALKLIRSGRVKATQICSDFIGLDVLPDFYRKMKAGEILKPMVVWPDGHSG
jgi:L-iditol 2-dehydrogenase